MLQNLKLRTQLLVMGTITTLISVPSGINSIYEVTKISNTVEEESAIHVPLMRNLATTDAMHDGIRAHVLNSLVGMYEGDAARIDDSIKEINSFSKKMNGLMSDTAKLKLPEKHLKLVIESEEIVKEYVIVAAKTADLAKKGNKVALKTGIATFDENFKLVEERLEKIGDELENYSKSTLEADNAAAQQSKNRIKIIVALSLLISAAVSYFLSYASAHKLILSISELQRIMETLTVASLQVGHDSQDMSESSIQLGSAIEQSVASITEMSAMLNQTADGANLCFEESVHGQREAEHGQQVVHNLIESVEAIESSHTELSQMSELISEISAKTQIINEIVSETRLLSFNASIEAARAGVHGRGFAVVAEEVGKLAVISGRAAQDIKILLADSSKRVDRVITLTKERVGAGMTSSKDCQSAFSAMKMSLSKIGESIQIISRATKEQQTGVKQVNSAVLEIERVNTKNTLTAESLAGQSKSLGKEIAYSNQQVEAIALFAGARKGTERKGYNQSNNEHNDTHRRNSQSHSSQNSNSIHADPTSIPPHSPSRSDKRFGENS